MRRVHFPYITMVRLETVLSAASPVRRPPSPPPPPAQSVSMWGEVARQRRPIQVDKNQDSKDFLLKQNSWVRYSVVYVCNVGGGKKQTNKAVPTLSVLHRGYFYSGCGLAGAE